jgi:hypothetical protein
MAPDKTFEALQTSTGNSLLFSIGTDNVFYVTQETSGTSTHGWTRTDLSTAQIVKDFPAGAICTGMSVAQDTQTGTTGLGMSLSAAGNDTLYLCLGNSNEDTSWLNHPVWIAFPFDDAQHPQATLKIVDIFISEVQVNAICTTGQYVVVDIVRDPSSAEPLISRYYIDTKKANGQAWQQHSLAIDLEIDRYTTCIGRTSQGLVDGLYTVGEVQGNSQFLYTPIFNVYSKVAPPSPSRLQVPGGLVVDSMGVYRHPDDTTDLFVTAGGGLYYFASTNQKDGATGVLLMNNAMFINVSKLYVFRANDNIIVWGLNSAGNLFYTSCPVTALTTAQSAWSLPLPIHTGVDMISPYINCVDNGNTIFAVADQTLYILTKSPDTSFWNTRQVTLPPLAATAPALSFSSYTTRIQLTGDNGQPAGNAPVTINASTRTTFYINNLYTVLDTMPIVIDTDMTGSITLIEPVSSLNCARITITNSDRSAITINPMDKPFQKVAQLNTTDGLSAAVITSNDGSTRPLVPAGTSTGDLQTTATGIQQLTDAYTSVSSDARIRFIARGSMENRITLTAEGTLALNPAITAEDIFNSISSDFGDLFNWLESGVDYVLTLVKDAATGVWNFIVKIAGQTYSAVLDCVEKVIGAVVWVFDCIKTLITDLIKFLEFLFELADIKRTKEVIGNMITLFLHYQASGLKNTKKDFDKAITGLQSQLADWAGLQWSGLGNAASALTGSGSTPTANSDSANTLLSHHFQNNAGSMSVKLPPPPADGNQSPVTALKNALTSESKVITGVISQLHDTAVDFEDLSLEQLLQKLAAIVAEGSLGTAQVIADALFDLLLAFADHITDILAAPVYIPVVSDILNAFGVTEPSLLDIFCWIAAVPATLIYKAVTGNAPFPDDSTTAMLIDATDFNELIRAFNPPVVSRRSKVRTASSNGLSLSPGSAGTIFCMGHTACGIFTFINAIVGGFEAASESGDNPYAIPAAVLAVCSAATAGIADALAPRDPVQSPAIILVGNATLGLRLAMIALFSGPSQKKIFGGDGAARQPGALMDAILVMPALVTTIFHFIELSKLPDGDTKSTAIIDETGSILSYISRVSYAAIVSDGKNDVTMGVYIASNICASGLQFAEANVGM